MAATPPSFRSVFIRRGGIGVSRAATHVVVAACNGGVRFRSSREGLAILLTCGLQRWRRLSPIRFGQVLWRLPRCFIHARFPLHPPTVGPFAIFCRSPSQGRRSGGGSLSTSGFQVVADRPSTRALVTEATAAPPNHWYWQWRRTSSRLNG